MNRLESKLLMCVCDSRLSRSHKSKYFCKLNLNEEAKEFRATGEEEAQKIRADAEDGAIVAEAKKQAQQVRGEGVSDAIRIYAESFGVTRIFSTGLWRLTRKSIGSQAHQWCFAIQHFSLF